MYMTVNLYDVLDIEHDCTKKDIIKAYRKLVKIYYPDKPTGDSDLFELINHAFDVLSNDEKRKEYDNLQKISEKVNKSHKDRAEEFEKFKELQTNAEITKTKEEAKLDFDENMAILDEKREFNRDQYEEEENNKLTSDDMNKMIEDLAIERDQDEIENQPKNIFGENDFDINKFNLAFERAKNNVNSITIKDRPKESNVMDSDYIGINDDYENVYGDSSDTSQFTDKNFTSITNNMENIDFSNLDGESKYNTHTEGKDNQEYKDHLEEMVKMREKETEDIKKMSLKDFNTNIKEGYGFLHEICCSDDFNPPKEGSNKFIELLDQRKKQNKENNKDDKDYENENEKDEKDHKNYEDEEYHENYKDDIDNDDVDILSGIEINKNNFIREKKQINNIKDNKNSI